MLTHLIALILAWSLTATPAARAQDPAPASQPDHSQEAFIIEQSQTTYRFENDGTGRLQSHVRVKVQSEAGVQYWGQLALGYNAATERIEIEFVRVHKADGSIVTAQADAVQDLTSPVQREAPVYTDFRQKHVTVAALRPGETLEFSATTHIHTPLAAGHFWMDYDFEKDNIALDERLAVDIPDGRPITLKTAPGNDPSVTEANGRRVYRWTSSHTTREEKKDADLQVDAAAGAEEPARAAVRLTTFQSWEQVGQWYSTLETGPRMPTPEIRRKAEELTAGKPTEVARLEALYDFVATNFRYVSISLGAARYQPRPASDVLRDQYGDCKDKHTLLASLIESIGLPVSTVLIHSEVKLDPDFPSPSQFDHVITRVASGAGPVWLDVTTEVAPFRLLSPGLRKKQALVVSPHQPAHLAETPADPPMANSHMQEIEGSLGALGRFSGRARFTLRGDLELLMRIIFRRTPAARWKDVVEQLNTSAGIGGEIGEWKVSDPAATRQAFEIEYQVSRVNFVDWTKKKVDLKLPFSDFALPEPSASKARSPIEFGSAFQMEYRLRLELGPEYRARAPVDVAITRDYADYRATYRLEGNTFSAERALHFRTRSLPADRAGDYGAFRRVVAADGAQALVLEIAAASSDAPAPDLKAGELNRSGFEALRSGNYAQAVTLLTRVVELEPEDRTAWNNLGRAYLGLRQTNEAIAAFNRQIEVNPYDEYAHINLGNALLQQRRYEEAEAAFRKQVEINPLDRYAHANLGRLYNETQKFDAAIAALERAISLTGDDASLHVELGTAHLNLGHDSRALASFARAAELSSAPPTWNNIAYQLALHGVQLDRALRYAESAVSAATAASRNFTVSHISARDLAVVGSIAAYWDTLGWIHFATEDLARAEKLVEAAWWLSQRSEIGDHLAQIYDKQGRRDDAVRLYAAALSADRPDPAIRDRLAVLVGGAQTVDEVLLKHAGDLTLMRTVPVDAASAPTGTADFFVLFDSASGVEAVSFVSGDEKLREMADPLQRAGFGQVFPGDIPAKLLRRGTLACTPDEGGTVRCFFVLVPAGEAAPPG